MSVGVTIDPGDPTPPYEQLRRQLATLIASGTLQAGERLAPVRQLAADLALAPGTVARTYRELESAGLVDTRRGAGTIVRTSAKPMSAQQRQRRLADLASDFVGQARLMGVTDEAIEAAVRDGLG